MPRRLPPLNALRAFEVAARSENFTRAAEELGVSQVAVSQQVKSLEAALGLKLFARDGKRLVITDAGKQYLAVVRGALDRICRGHGPIASKQAVECLYGQHLTGFRRQVARAPAWTICGGPPKDRPPRLHDEQAGRSHRRACGPCDPPWRWALGGSRCGRPRPGTALAGLQPKTHLWPQTHHPGIRSPEASSASSRRLDYLVEMVRSRRRLSVRSTRAGTESGQHAHRRRH